MKEHGGGIVSSMSYTVTTDMQMLPDTVQHGTLILLHAGINTITFIIF